MKYLEERRKADGTKYFAFNPTRAVRNALGVTYQRFTDRRDAEVYCLKIASDFNLHRRKRENEVKVDDNSVQALINFYKTTQAWLKLKENSQIFYDLCFRTATEAELPGTKASFGELNAREVTAIQADRLFTFIQQSVSLHRAVNSTKVLRVAYNVAYRHDKVYANPFAKMRTPGLPTRKVLWEPEQVSQVINMADKMGYPSIGTITLLTYDLCARPGDMRQLTWDNYAEGVFNYVQEKNGTPMAVPASPRLIERLETIRDRQKHIAICERTGKPYSKDRLIKYFARIRRASGVPTHLQLRDLRRTGATEMAEHGCTEDELRAVTGHQSREILATYVRPTVKLASSAVNKRFA